MYKPVINFVYNQGYIWNTNAFGLCKSISKILFDGWEEYVASSVQEYFHIFDKDNRFTLGALYTDDFGPHDYEIGMGGTCHVGETDKDAIIREIKEEMGVLTNPEVLLQSERGRKTDTLYTVDLDKPHKISLVKYKPIPDIDDTLRKVHCLFISKNEDKIHELIVSIMKNKLGTPLHENIIGFMVINMKDARKFIKMKK